jgi:O-antigen/teichoic acid export membrane protein
LPSLVSLVVAIPWLGGALHRDEARRRESAARRPVPEIASEFWRFTIYQALATIVQIVLLRLDVLLVGGIENSKQAGIYSAASRYLTPGVMFSTAIVFVVGPQLAGMIARKDFDRARNVYQTATLWLSVLSFPMYIAIAVYATLLMRIFGPGFSAGATALQILSIAMLLNMATGAVRSALFMGGKSSWILWDNTAALVSNIVLNVILIPEFGINGAAVAWAVSIAIGNLLPLYQVKGLWGLQPVGAGYLTAIAASVLCFGVLGLLFRALLGDSIPAFIAYAVVSSAIYCAWAWRSRRLLQIDAFGEALRLRRSRSAQA